MPEIKEIVYMRVVLFIILLFLSASAEAQDSVSGKCVEVSIMTEVNYGREHGDEDAALVDFPHLLLCGEAELGRGGLS